MQNLLTLQSIIERRSVTFTGIDTEKSHITNCNVLILSTGGRQRLSAEPVNGIAML